MRGRTVLITGVESPPASPTRCTIVIEDRPEGNAVDMRVWFDPPVGPELLANQFLLSAAQKIALGVIGLLGQVAGDDRKSGGGS
jgi:hypothetical protein